MKTMKQWIVWPVMVVAIVLAAGCQDNSGEKAGKELDKAAAATKDALKDAGNKVKDATK